MKDTRILVVDDEPDITELLRLYLEQEGYLVFAADNGQEALQMADELQPDLILLDIQLKGNLDGLAVCRSLRERADVPVLFISCKSEDTDIIHGLSIGGDDYITKPFSPKQLVARVKAHLRRVAALQADKHKTDAQVLVYDKLVIDRAAHTVTLDGVEVTLSAKEYDLLTYLASHPNKAFELDRLYQIVWGTDSVGDTRTLMVHISNLRKKIEPDPANPTYIATVRGVGYRFIG